MRLVIDSRVGRRAMTLRPELLIVDRGRAETARIPHTRPYADSCIRLGIDRLSNPIGQSASPAQKYLETFVSSK